MTEYFSHSRKQFLFFHQKVSVFTIEWFPKCSFSFECPNVTRLSVKYLQTTIYTS